MPGPICCRTCTSPYAPRVSGDRTIFGTGDQEHAPGRPREAAPAGALPPGTRRVGLPAGKTEARYAENLSPARRVDPAAGQDDEMSAGGKGAGDGRSMPAASMDDNHAHPGPPQLPKKPSYPVAPPGATLCAAGEQQECEFPPGLLPLRRAPATVGCRYGRPLLRHSSRRSQVTLSPARATLCAAGAAGEQQEWRFPAGLPVVTTTRTRSPK